MTLVRIICFHIWIAHIGASQFVSLKLLKFKIDFNFRLPHFKEIPQELQVQSFKTSMRKRSVAVEARIMDFWCEMPTH